MPIMAEIRTKQEITGQGRLKENRTTQPIDCFVGGTVTGKHKKRKHRTRNVSIGHDTKNAVIMSLAKRSIGKTGGF